MARKRKGAAGEGEGVKGTESVTLAGPNGAGTVMAPVTKPAEPERCPDDAVGAMGPCPNCPTPDECDARGDRWRLNNPIEKQYADANAWRASVGMPPMRPLEEILSGAKAAGAVVNAMLDARPDVMDAAIRAAVLGTPEAEDEAMAVAATVTAADLFGPDTTIAREEEHEPDFELVAEPWPRMAPTDAETAADNLLANPDDPEARAAFRAAVGGDGAYVMSKEHDGGETSKGRSPLGSQFLHAGGPDLGVSDEPEHLWAAALPEEQGRCSAGSSGNAGLSDLFAGVDYARRQRYSRVPALRKLLRPAPSECAWCGLTAACRMFAERQYDAGSPECSLPEEEREGPPSGNAGLSSAPTRESGDFGVSLVSGEGVAGPIRFINVDGPFTVTPADGHKVNVAPEHLTPEAIAAAVRAVQSGHIRIANWTGAHLVSILGGEPIGRTPALPNGGYRCDFEGRPVAECGTEDGAKERVEAAARAAGWSVVTNPNPRRR